MEQRRYSHLLLGDENFTPTKMESFSEEKVFTYLVMRCKLHPHKKEAILRREGITKSC
jgi:hypothetical protein